MLAYSFGEEEVDRYIMIFKKDSPPSEDELNALRNGQEWNDDIAKRLLEQVCIILFVELKMLYNVMLCIFIDIIKQDLDFLKISYIYFIICI